MTWALKVRALLLKVEALALEPRCAPHRGRHPQLSLEPRCAFDNHYVITYFRILWTRASFAKVILDSVSSQF